MGLRPLTHCALFLTTLILPKGFHPCQHVSSRTGTFTLFTPSRYSYWEQLRTVTAGGGGLVTAVALCSLLPVVSSAQGALGQAVGDPVLPWQWENGPGEARRKFGSTKSTQHLLPRSG